MEDLLDSTKKQQMNKPPRKNESLVDETFWVWETRFGLWSTQTVDGYEFTLGLTGMTSDAFVEMTRWHLKHLQEGDLDQYTRVV